MRSTPWAWFFLYFAVLGVLGEEQLFLAKYAKYRQVRQGKQEELLLTLLS
jgi:hypothetical protein